LNIAIIGCGYVCEFYLATLPAHPELNLLGIWDHQDDRSKRLSDAYQLKVYSSLEELLDDDQVQMVLNLTNPRSHYDVSKKVLQHGKHVYSEKPLAMDFASAKELVALANSKKLLMVSAPCNLLGETAQTLWRALREKCVGKVRLVYANIDDGMVHLLPTQEWVSSSGIPWPTKDEFEVGCTIQHAGYYVGWLVAFFGAATSVTSFGSIQIEDKLTTERLNRHSADFSVACIQFANGVVARLTCSIVAPHDHSLQVIGDLGVLYTDECWDYRSPVYSRKRKVIRSRVFLNPVRKRHTLPSTPYKTIRKAKGQASMDFSRGPAELASAIKNNRPCRLSNEFSLHVNEITLAINTAQATGEPFYKMTTTCGAIEPMDWAE